MLLSATGHRESSCKQRALVSDCPWSIGGRPSKTSFAQVHRTKLLHISPVIWNSSKQVFCSSPLKLLDTRLLASSSLVSCTVLRDLSFDTTPLVLTASRIYREVVRGGSHKSIFPFYLPLRFHLFCVLHRLLTINKDTPSLATDGPFCEATYRSTRPVLQRILKSVVRK